MESKNILASATHKIILAAMAVIAALAFTFAPTNDAQAQGFEIGAGFGWIGCVNHHVDDHGFHIMVTPGYRIINWVGVYVDESFGGLWYTKNDRNDDGHFIGHTIFNAKFFLQLGPGELWGKFGIGAVYYAHDGWSDGAFALKLGVGYTADIWGNIGIGGNFDYMLGAWEGWTGNYLDIQVHVRFKF